MFKEDIEREFPLVLVVDDDSTMRFLARESLEQAGFAVVEAENGIQALSIFTTMRPQIIILDLLMPEMDGFDVCIALRQFKNGDTIPVLVMTSLDDIESINRAYEVGATDFITKPINWTVLSNRVRYMVRATHVADELRRSEAKNRAILDALPDVMFRVNREGNLLEVTSKKDGAPGLPVGEFSGKPLWEMLPAEVAERAMQEMDRVLRTGITQLFEFELQCHGATRHFETRLVACGEDESLCIVRDVSEQKWAERQHSMLERQLRQAQKMEAIGTMAGGIAHDFNNILSVIMGYTELALIKIREEKSACKKLHQVLRASERAKDLVQQILSFSSQQEEERKPLVVSAIVKETLKMLRASLPTTIEIRRHIMAGSGMILADPSQMQQVLMNLYTNAAYAMRENGGVLAVNLESVDLDSSSVPIRPDLKPGPYLKLTVSDTGTGIERAVMERIFDPFFTTKAFGEGTGMGLAMAYGIVQSYGGFISVESEPGKGSSFEVLLPRIDYSENTMKNETLPHFMMLNGNRERRNGR